MPPASRSLRLLAFAVPAALGASAAQPLLAALTGSVGPAWALELTGPGLLAAGALLMVGRVTDRRLGEPPWYSAWALLPGAFLLAGAASMCLFGAFVELPAVRVAAWGLGAAGGVAWSAALAWVRLAGTA